MLYLVVNVDDVTYHATRITAAEAMAKTACYRLCIAICSARIVVLVNNCSQDLRHGTL